MSNSFHVARSHGGYRVELFRSGKPYVTFVDGLNQGGGGAGGTQPGKALAEHQD